MQHKPQLPPAVLALIVNGSTTVEQVMVSGLIMMLIFTVIIYNVNQCVYLFNKLISYI